MILINRTDGKETTESETSRGEERRMAAMEKRLAALEAKLLDRSDRLHSRVSESLERLEERFEDEVLPSAVNPLDHIGVNRGAKGGSALKEFSDIMSVTRKHFDDARGALRAFRQSVGGE